jgi:dipeptidase D
MTASTIDSLEPPALWKYFSDLSRIPRESKHEKAAGEFVVRVAKALGLEHVRDGAGNVLVRVPASSGRERVGSVCLQSHLDMVCVKRTGSRHDFRRNPITLVRQDGFVSADGTTLGADNGVAVATGLAIMADRALVRGPLELLFTVDEETGMTGARRLAPGLLKSRTLINLDSEDEGVLTVGCAGGADTVGTWSLATEVAKAGGVALDVSVSGLRGGHSGVEIHQGRGNAIKMLCRVVSALADLDARVSRFEGGSKRNAIPAFASARIVVPRLRLDETHAVITRLKGVLEEEIGSVEPAFVVVVDAPKARPWRVYRRAFQRDVLRVLAGLPHGVVKMSAAIPGLVETSTNVAVLKQTARTLSLATSQRSLVLSERDEMVGVVRAILELGGASVLQGDPYPGWKPDLTSPILAVAVSTYRDTYGREPKVEAIHAGLECGIIGERYPGMDMISLGPTIRDAHSPDERVDIASVKKYWDYLLAILKNVN